jgi:Flp pilus assembly protein TadG
MASDNVSNKTNQTKQGHAQQRHGAILPLTAIMLVLLLGMVAFAVDLGYLALARTEIQAAADAGALAASLAIEQDDPNEVMLLAQRATQANNVAGSPAVIIPQEDVQLGTWDSDAGQFTPLTGADQFKANSVRVTCRRTLSRANEIPLYFARLLGAEMGEVSATAIALRRPVCGTFIGLESTELNGNGAYTDSYNSDLGTYDSQVPGDKGHLCSNGPIDVQNGSVHGNAIPGPGQTVSITSGTVTGKTTPRKEPLSMPPVDFGDVMTNNDNEQLDKPPYNAGKQTFRHNGGGLNLPGGTFFFTDVSITGGPIIVNEPTTIYVKGDFSVMGDGIVNVTHKPSNLRVFVEGRSVKISGDADFSGIVYAPDTDIVVGGSGAFFGGAVGESLKFHNTGGVHADESLMSPLSVRSRLVD